MEQRSEADQATRHVVQYDILSEENNIADHLSFPVLNCEVWFLWYYLTDLI